MRGGYRRLVELVESKGVPAQEVSRFFAYGMLVNVMTMMGLHANPEPWADRTDDKLVAEQLAHRVQQLLPELPDVQRQVVLLRDVEGLPPSEVASMLSVTDGHQRVLLHRGRAKVRRAVESYFEGSLAS